MLLRGETMLSKLLMLILLGTAEPWYEQKMEGWYYFQEEEDQKRPEYTCEEAREILEEEKQNLNSLLAAAVLTPSPETVREYKKEHDRWQAQSALFAQNWAEVETQKEDLQSISDQMFLLFCFKGNDPCSIEAATTAKEFCHNNGWKLKALSLDGTTIEGLEVETDRGLSEKIGVQTTPSFYAIDPLQNRVLYLGEGMLSTKELQHNIELMGKNQQP